MLCIRLYPKVQLNLCIGKAVNIRVCFQLFATHIVFDNSGNPQPSLCVTEYLRTFFSRLFRICCSGDNVLDTSLCESLREITGLATHAGAGMLGVLRAAHMK